MTHALVSVVLEEEGYEIPYASVKSFKLFTSMYSSFPYGELEIGDPEGRYLTYLAIKPGSLITVTVVPQTREEGSSVPTTDYNKKIVLCRFCVVGIQNKGVNLTLDNNEKVQLGSLGGNITLQLTHPWALYTDYSNRSFRKNSSTIIRELVQNPRRGITLFKPNQIKIDESDDSGSTVVRFKLGESESQFIHRKVLPFTTIAGQPSYSFIDELGVFHLHNFKTMYGVAAKALVLPPPTEGYSGLLTKEDKGFVLLPFYDGSWGVGRKFIEQIGKIKKYLYVEEPVSQSTLRAQLSYQSAIPGYVLIKKDLVDKVTSASGVTEASIIPFRDFGDAIRVDVNDTAIMDEFFQIEVTTELSLDGATVGTPVELRLAGDPPSTKHWASGKWLVTDTEHFTKDDRYFTKLHLGRPAIDAKSMPNNIDKDRLYLSAGA